MLSICIPRCLVTSLRLILTFKLYNKAYASVSRDSLGKNGRNDKSCLANLLAFFLTLEDSTCLLLGYIHIKFLIKVMFHITIYNHAIFPFYQ